MSQQTGTMADPLDVAAVLRALRRRADLSQRQLAARSGVPAGTLGRLEAGQAADPKLRTVERLVRATGARLAVLDVDGTEPAAIATDSLRDRGGRRFPAHLDPAPETRWRKGWQEVISFFRSRWARDRQRRDGSGERRWDMFTEIRRLGPGDGEVLAALRAGATGLDDAAATEPADTPLSDQDALRYLRDPSVRHWIAEDRGRVFGQLVAYVQQRHAGPPTMLVTEFAVLPEHHERMLGVLLAAALCDEADRLHAGEIVAITRDPAAVNDLRCLGFQHRLKLPVLVWRPGRAGRGSRRG